jgi:hypothetical protein
MSLFHRGRDPVMKTPEAADFISRNNVVRTSVARLLSPRFGPK